MESSSGIIIILLEITVIAIVIAGMWKVYVKANQPGWVAIVPLYNIYILLKIVGKPGWWLLLYFVPIANIVVNIKVSIALANAFGKSSTFGILGLWLFSIVGYPILGFGNSKFIGTTQQSQAPVVPPPVQPITPVSPQPTVPPQQPTTN